MYILVTIGSDLWLIHKLESQSCGFDSKFNYQYEKFGKQISQHRPKGSHNNRPVNFSQMSDLATAALAIQD